MEKAEEIWTEKELAEKFGLSIKKGRSRAISNWIYKGLKRIEISGLRCFREKDIVDFFNRQFEGSQND